MPTACIIHVVDVVLAISGNNIESRLNHLIWRILVETKAVALPLKSLHDLSKLLIHPAPHSENPSVGLPSASAPAYVEVQQMVVVELSSAG